MAAISGNHADVSHSACPTALNRGRGPMRSRNDGRRLFFEQFAGEVIAWIEELGGTPHFKLADLGELPQSSLASLIPQVCADAEIIADSEKAYARNPGSSSPDWMFDFDERNTFIFNRFNGRNSIGRVAEELSAAMSLDLEESYDHVRELFLRLVRLRVCMPRNAVATEGHPHAGRQRSSDD
jgi:hypothetical protein